MYLNLIGKPNVLYLINYTHKHICWWSSWLAFWPIGRSELEILGQRIVYFFGVVNFWCGEGLGNEGHPLRMSVKSNFKENQHGGMSVSMYLCWQGSARNGMVGLARQMGQAVSSSAELEALSLENGLRRFLMDDELRRGRSNKSISCNWPRSKRVSPKYIISTNNNSSTMQIKKLAE